MNENVYVLVLAGGVGSRLWPKSRNSLPKQFLNVTGQETLIQMTIRRILPLVSAERIFVATGTQYVDLVQAQLPALPFENIIAEPSGKNTAPAIGLGAIHIARANPNSVMVVLTADHIIPDEDTFRQAVQAAIDVCRTGQFATLGVTPTGPETGFGYIQRGGDIGEFQNQTVYNVAAFLEKPALAKAQTFYESGNYYWNSGMFIWQTADLLEGFETHMPMLSCQLDILSEALFHPHSTRSVAEIWSHIEAESIDFGLMEKVNNVVVVPLDAGWNDVGDWSALYRELAHNGVDNVVVNAKHMAVDSQRVMIQGANKLVATIGLEDVVIVEDEGMLLVCKMDRTQDVKRIVETLKQNRQQAYL
ncbi:MAG: mannose-1-phosphate guanylyltransferase [Chloroflexota bacterium]